MKSILILLTLISILTACHRKPGNDVVQKPLTTTDTLEVKKEADLVASFEKTACYGKCPVYQVKFYANGKATWYGRFNVERMGWHEVKVESAVLKRIQDKAKEIGFFELADEYPLPGEPEIADLPSTIIYLKTGDLEKQVTDKHEAPEKLKEFEKFLEDLITGLNWKPSN